MTDIENYKEKIFDEIKHVDGEGNEYWLARELQYVWGYRQWRNINVKNNCKERRNVL